METFKSFYKKQQKKNLLHKQPVFRQIFLRYFCLFAVIALLAGFVGTQIAIYGYNKVQSSQFSSNYLAAEKRVKETYTTVYGAEAEEEKGAEEIDIPIEQEGGITPLGQSQAGTDTSEFERWKTLLHYSFALQSFNCAIALYDAETKELYADSSEMVFMIMQEEENETVIYKSPAALWKDAFSVFEQQYKDGEQNYIDFQVEDIYIQNYTFVPGSVQIVERDGNTDEIIDVIAEYNMSPEDAEQYRHMELSERDWRIRVGPIMAGTQPDEPIMKSMKAWMEAEEEYIWSLDTGFDWEETGADGSVTIIELSDNLKVRLIVFDTYNLFEEYDRQIGLIYAVMFFLTVLLAWVLSYRNFQIANARYQMDQYRRNTTNAMAHDLKTPLMAISGYAENLQNNIHPEKHKHYVESILNNVQYMNEMIGDILELSKVEISGRRSEKTEVYLAALTDTLLKKYEVLIEERGLHVHIQGETAVQVDSGWINQALDNLLGNAIKYADKGTDIRVCISEDFYEVRNMARDNLGQPIEKLAEPFVKGDNSRSGKQGTGIGLAIVRQIAELHGFTLELESGNEEFVARLVF